MIPLLPVPKPEILTDEYVREKTAHFIATGERVWGSVHIERTLLAMGRNKCAYCECNIHEESKYMEVEHFKPKKLYPNEVLNWDNLLPSCKRCNGIKSNHDVVAEPLVNPRFDLPGEHLVFKVAYIFGKSDSGKSTVEKIDLNEVERMVTPRVEIADRIDLILQEWQQRLHDISPLHPTEWPRLQQRLATLLAEAGPAKDYAAFTATYLLRHPDYHALRKAMNETMNWTPELEAAEQAALALALFP